MLKHSKWKGQDPRKVIKKKEFKDWLIKKVQKIKLTDIPIFILK